MSKVENDEVLQSILLKIKDLDKRIAVLYKGKIKPVASVNLNVKEVAAELMKGILPRIEDLQKQIKALDKRINVLDGKLQNISSVIINKRKHQKS